MAKTRESLEARRTWPVRVHRLGQEPREDQSGITTASERLESMWELSRDAWVLAGRPLPSYTRGETPVSCRTAGLTRPARS